MQRKILRNRARLNMTKEGITRQNKRHWVRNPRTGLMERMPSYFSEHWREYAGKAVSK